MYACRDVGLYGQLHKLLYGFNDLDGRLKKKGNVRLVVM